MEAGERSQQPGRFYRLAWVVYLVLAIAGLIWIGSRLGTIPLSLFLRPETLAIDFGLGLAAGGLLIGAWAGMRRVVPAAHQLEVELREMLGPLDLSEVMALALLSGLARSEAVEGAGSTRPWLQDFSLGEPLYEAPEVRARGP